MLILLSGASYLAICTFNLSSYELNFWHTVDCPETTVGSYLKYTTVAKVSKNNFALLIGNSTFLDYFHLNFDKDVLVVEEIMDDRVSRSHGFSKQMSSVSIKRPKHGESNDNRSVSKIASEVHPANGAKKHEGFVSHARISMRQPTSMKELESPTSNNLKDIDLEDSNDLRSWKPKPEKISHFQANNMSDRSKPLKKSVTERQLNNYSDINSENEGNNEVPTRMVGENPERAKKKGSKTHIDRDTKKIHKAEGYMLYSPGVEQYARKFNFESLDLPPDTDSVLNQMMMHERVGASRSPQLISSLHKILPIKPRSSTHESNSAGAREMRD